MSRRPVLGRRRRARERAGPALLVLAAVAFGLVELTRELTPVAYLNDVAFHTEMIRFARARLAAGHDPLTSWFSPVNLGSPAFLHYQSLPSIITGSLAGAIGVEHAYEWTVYVLLSTWPIAVYFGGRLFGLNRWASAAAAACSPLLVSAPGVGYEWGSYLWIGWGVWTQLWAMWLMPLAWGATWRALSARRNVGWAALLCGLVVSLHYLSGYMVAIPFLALPLAALGRARRFWWFVRGSLLTGLAGLLVASWVIVPVYTQRHWAARNEFLAGTSSANSFGARRILAWLFDGQLLDDHRLPVVTALVFVGLVACAVRARRDLRARALLALFVLALLAFFGRTTWGPLMNVVPGAADLFLRRFLAGVQLSALWLAGVGAVVVARVTVRLLGDIGSLLRLARTGTLAGSGLRPAGGGALLRAFVALAAAALGLAPAWSQLAAYAGLDGRDIAYQAQIDATLGARVDHLIARADTVGGGRIFGGLIGTALGQSNRVGYVPVYTWLSDRGVDAIGFTLRSASLMANAETSVDWQNPADDELFAIRYLLLPVSSAPPPVLHARLLGSAGGLSLWDLAPGLAGTGFLQVVDTSGTITENRTDIGTASLAFLESGTAADARYPTVAYDGRPAPRPTLAPGQVVSGSPGAVLSEHVDLAAGSAAALVRANRPAVVLLKASYDPGWHASVDGHPAPTEMIAPAMVGVEVGPGVHRVAFTYVGYGQYPLWLAVSAAAALVALGGGPVLRRFGRRRVPARRT